MAVATSIADGAIVIVDSVKVGMAMASGPKDADGAVTSAAGSGSAGDAGTSSDQVHEPHLVKWTNHGFKHFPPKSAAWKDIVSSTKGGPAKYHPTVAIEKIERLVWEKGKLCTNGKPWKVMKFTNIIGAKNGLETTCIRVECSGKTIHGHPITFDEYLKLIN